MHIPVLQVPWTGWFLAVPIPLGFRFSNSSRCFVSTFIARKHVHLPGSGDRRASPGRVALWLAAPGPPSAGLSTTWPSISSHRRT